MVNKIYLLSYVTGTYDDRREVNIKGFESLEDCQRYEVKFNKLIQKVIKISSEVREKISERDYEDISEFEYKYFHLYHQWSEFRRTNIKEIEIIKASMY